MIRKCNKCYNNSCNGSCNKSVTRQIRLQNNSIGRDGESAYETYLRRGGTLTEADWLISLKGDKGESNPDEEDITEVVEGQENVLKFKDRKFQQDSKKGLGYKIVRQKNNNILSQADFSETNTIYEIRYDFDLNGLVIEFPDNITLYFNGGSLSNGSLKGLNTKIDAPLVKVFDSISFEGTFMVESTYPEWFGAVAYKQNMNTSAWWWSPNAEPVNGIDSSKAFNEAIVLAQNSGGKCTAKSGIYKITDTVNIPNYVKLHIPSGSGVFAIMQGEGNIVIEADKDSQDWKYVQQGGIPPHTLKVNEYFDSDCMAVAFRMTARGTAITGGGTISIALSRHTIGILMEGNQFATVNMVFAPELDIKVIGGSTNRSIPDPDDIVILEAPNSAEAIAKGNVGDFAYFPNLPNKETRVKTNETTWTFWCNESEFNTCFRTEVLSNDNRIINLHANVWLDWGFRGIENIARNGGWFNQAVWTGTVSDMHSNYVSFFGNSNQGLSTHDMTKQSYQVHPKMSSQCRLIALYGLTGGVHTGNTWDLLWAPPARVEIAYEYGARAQRNKVLIDGSRYEKDESTYRTINDNYRDRLLKNFKPYSNYVNILKYDQGKRVNVFARNHIKLWRKYTDFVDPRDYKTFSERATLPYEIGEDVLPKRLFDEVPENPITVIDTVDSNISTSIFHLFRAGSRRGEKIKIVFDYSIPTPRGNDGLVVDAYITITSRTTYNDSPSFFRTKKLKRKNAANDGGRFLIDTIIFEENELPDLANCTVMFTTNNPSKPVKVDLYNIRVIADNWIGDQLDIMSGTTAMRPDACPKGFIYEDTTLNNTYINKGTSDDQLWLIIPTEDVGTWSLNGDIITVSSCSYSKIGKQVNLSGRVTIPSGYELNSPIPVILPFAPDFGGVYTIGDLEFTLGRNTNATLRSKVTGANKPFQLNFKTS